MKQHTYSTRMIGDGYSIHEYGLLRILDNQVLLCGTHVAKFCEEFDGKWVELVVCSPQPLDPTPMDPLIEPLVKKIQSLGFTTVSSCQGHLDPDIWWRFPFVTFWGRPDIPVASTWMIEPTGQINLYNLRAIGVASTEEELTALQARIPDQMAVLG